VGTEIVHAIPLAIIAGLGHLFMGNVDVRLLGNLLLGSIPGVIVGSLVANRAPAGLLRAAISLILVAVSVKLILT
jgi:uncharacterized membrane protein YfcA